MIDGIVFGTNPRHGYVKDDEFVHPDLAFRFPIPAGWRSQNTPTQVVVANEEGNAATIFTLEPEATSPGEAASAFVSETGAEVESQRTLQIHGHAAARVVGTVTLLLAYLIIVSYQYRAGAAVVERLLPGEGTDTLAVIGVAVFVILYTALAGMYSVAYTDVVNGLIMVLGIGAALVLVTAKGGGVAAVAARLPADLRVPTGAYSPVDYASILLPPFLLLLGDANMYQRFFSARDAGSARRATLWLLGGIVALEAAIIALAIAGRALLPDVVNPAYVIVETAFRLVPPALGALLISAILAVVVSTADSYLLSPSTAVVRDIYQRFIRPEDRKSVV